MLLHCGFSAHNSLCLLPALSVIAKHTRPKARWWPWTKASLHCLSVITNLSGCVPYCCESTGNQGDTDMLMSMYTCIPRQDGNKGIMKCIWGLYDSICKRKLYCVWNMWQLSAALLQSNSIRVHLNCPQLIFMSPSASFMSPPASPSSSCCTQPSPSNAPRPGFSIYLTWSLIALSHSTARLSALLVVVLLS